MHHLLEGAVAHAKANGAAVIEGYPVQSAGERVDVISGYVGTSISSRRRASNSRARPPDTAAVASG